MLTNEELLKIVDIGIELTNQKDKNKLLENILDAAMDISKSDAGTLYLYKENRLYFSIMKTISQGVEKGTDDTIDMPPVEMTEKNVCSYVAIHRKMINIADVYNAEEFDFTGPKKYDQLTGYHTGSMIVFPMINTDGRLIGVIQLINSIDDEGNVCAYTDDHELVLRSLGSQAAVALSNILYTEEIKEQMHSFVEAFTSAVDERTPYNGNHTRKVAQYAVQLAKYINHLYQKGETDIYFDDNRLEQLELAAMLHDIGKMIVPLEVMNKATRLDGGLEIIKKRFEQIRSYYEIDYLKERISEDEYRIKADELSEIFAFLCEIDAAGFLSDEKLLRVNEISRMKYVSCDGTELSYITEDEAMKLSVRKGTLTDEERKIMESHVVMTEKILSHVSFNKNYENVPVFAAQHHECINGTGYPKMLSGDELPLESRILAVADIYDALTSSDRPYKKPMPQEKAFAILHDMADKEGRLEGRLVDWLEDVVKLTVNRFYE